MNRSEARARAHSRIAKIVKIRTLSSSDFDFGAFLAAQPLEGSLDNGIGSGLGEKTDTASAEPTPQRSSTATAFAVEGAIGSDSSS